MRELFTCWRHTRMLVLMAFCAALFVAVLLPFKIAVIIPGITEIRPAAALPVLFSLLFGPAAAWGAGFGNIIGDVLSGTIGPGSFFGFFGNLIYAFVPYRVMRIYHSGRITMNSVNAWVTFLLGLTLASALCALIIAIGVALIGIPFDLLVHTIFLNNMLMSLLLVPFLMRALARRIVQMRLTYEQLLDSDEISRPLLGKAGPLLLLAIVIAVYVIRINPAFMETLPFLQNAAVAGITLPALLVLLSLLLL